jgi:hypothetical protein
LSDDADDLESPSTGVSNSSLPSSENTLNHGINSGRAENSTTSKASDVVVNATTSLVDNMENSILTSEGYSNPDEGNAVIHNRITVVLLDTAQKRFPIDADPDWKVHTFKLAGYKIHKVAPQSQRLIFRGRMLEDSKTLKEMGIFQSEVIIHLFPKPRVKLVADASETSTDRNTEEEDSGGAHVPQIFLDEEEQERRGQILVLGSHEIAEAQNNVRLLCLLLGTICFMRILTLLSIAMGADEVAVYEDDLTPPESAGGSNSTDDGMYPHYDYEPRVWKNEDYFDLLVSVVGFFVARLGMKATHENTSRIAFQYLIGTLIAGILWTAWNVFEFTLFFKTESAPKDDDTQVPLTDEDFRTIALFTVILPMGVWVLCCARAWHFRLLLTEAELEAAERIRSELNLSEGGGTRTNGHYNEANGQELEDLSSSSHRHTIV